jgi:hypothetical protein
MRLSMRREFPDSDARQDNAAMLIWRPLRVVMLCHPVRHGAIAVKIRSTPRLSGITSGETDAAEGSF